MGTVVCGNGWGWGQSYAGMDGDDLETAGIGVGVGIKVTGTVGVFGDGYKYLSPCSSLARMCMQSFVALSCILRKPRD